MYQFLKNIGSLALKRTISSVTTALIFLSLFGVLIVWFGYTMYDSDFQAARLSIQSKLLGIAKTAASTLDSDRFKKDFYLPQKQPDFSGYLEKFSNTPGFSDWRRTLRKIIHSNEELNLGHDNVYIFVLDHKQPSVRSYWAVMDHKKSFAGEPYLLTDVMEGMVVAGKAGVASDVYLSQASNSEWISAYGLINDTDGTPMGIVEVAWPAQQYLTALEERLTERWFILIAITVISILVAMALFLFAARSDRMRLRLEDVLEEAKRREEKLGKAQLYDALTGLPNKHYFSIKLETTVSVARSRKVSKYIVILVDLARFSYINSTYGPRVGDQLLKSVAKKLGDMVRLNTELKIAARFHGDNFCLLIEADDLDDPKVSEQMVSNLRANLVGDYLVNIKDGETKELHMDISLGVVHGHEGYFNASEILRDAAAALKLAKNLDGKHTVHFSSNMHTDIASVVEMETELRRALSLALNPTAKGGEGSGELSINYQPIISLAGLKDNEPKVVAFEALVRWHHPRLGYIPPNVFVNLAEQSLLIGRLQEFVFEQSLFDFHHLLKGQHATGSIQLSLNVSSKQFDTEGLAGLIEEKRERYGIPTAKIKLEITEGVSMKRSAREKLDNLSQLGYEIAIDDFGTGYSSLQYLSDYAFDTIKIDKKFVQDEAAFDLAKAIVGIGHVLNKRIIAEGVETLEQAKLLYEEGCVELQGYLFARPMPYQELTKFLTEFSSHEIVQKLLIDAR